MSEITWRNSDARHAAYGRVTRTGTYLTETGVESGTVEYDARDYDEILEQDARDYPHDEQCRKCGRRQWTDETAPETCQSCGWVYTDPDDDPDA